MQRLLLPIALMLAAWFTVSIADSVWHHATYGGPKIIRLNFFVLSGMVAVLFIGRYFRGKW